MQPKKEEAPKARTGRGLNIGDDNPRPHVSNSTVPTEQVAFCDPSSLAIHHFEEMATAISEFEIRWLMKRGVSEDALWKPWPIGATIENGVRYLAFVAFDGDMPLDIVLWQPRTCELVAYSGRAVFLGDLSTVMSSATYFAEGALTIHSDPLEWLRANREGVVIVNEKLAGAYLRDVPRVFCRDVETARRVKKIVRPAKPTVKVFTAHAQGGSMSKVAVKFDDFPDRPVSIEEVDKRKLWTKPTIGVEADPASLVRLRTTLPALSAIHRNTPS